MQKTEKKNNTTKDQHYVPRFYLKNFAAKDGFLEVLNIKEKRVEKRRPYQGLGYAEYYYAKNTGTTDKISQKIELWLGSIEDSVSKHLSRIIKEILGNGQIQENDKYILSKLISMLLLRTPKMRTRIKESDDRVYKQIEKMYGPEHAKQFKSTDNIQHLMLMTGYPKDNISGFANLLFHMNWKAYIARGKAQFITSDSPVVELWLPPTGFRGSDFLERPKYFSLTPNILFELTYHKGSTKIKRKTLYEKDFNKIKELNIKIADGADHYIYSEKKETLTDILSGRNNPGYLELEHYRKFIKPWTDFKQDRY